MSAAQLKAGDRVGYLSSVGVCKYDEFKVNDLGFVVATIDGSDYWIRTDALTAAPKPFLPSGKDKFAEVNVGCSFVSGLSSGAFVASYQHVIKIDGQTGELSWEKGGPA